MTLNFCCCNPYSWKQINRLFSQIFFILEWFSTKVALERRRRNFKLLDSSDNQNRNLLRYLKIIRWLCVYVASPRVSNLIPQRVQPENGRRSSPNDKTQSNVHTLIPYCSRFGGMGDINKPKIKITYCHICTFGLP